MKLSVFMMLLVVMPGIASAQVVELSDHSLPKAKMRTYHAKCSNGRLGIIRADPSARPVRVCVAVQDASRPEQCLEAAPETTGSVVRAAADALCR